MKGISLKRSGQHLITVTFKSHCRLKKLRITLNVVAAEAAEAFEQIEEDVLSILGRTAQ